MFLLVNYCIEMRGWLQVRSGERYCSTFRPNLQKLFISAKFVTLSCHVVLFLIILMLLLYSSFVSFSAKLEMSSYRLQGYEGRSVQFATCVKVCAYLRKFEFNSNRRDYNHLPIFDKKWKIRSFKANYGKRSCLLQNF